MIPERKLPRVNLNKPIKPTKANKHSLEWMQEILADANKVAHKLTTWENNFLANILNGINQTWINSFSDLSEKQQASFLKIEEKLYRS